MQFLVTGATGHLGNTVVKQLIEQNHTVSAIVLPKDDVTCLQNVPVTFLYGNILDKAFLQSVITPNVTVIHMAGIVDITRFNKHALFEVNIRGTQNVADVCFEKNARLVYTSSVHVIDPKQGEVLKEPTIFNEKKIVGLYAKSKTLATKYVFQKIQQGLQAVVVYPAGIIGPNDYKVSNIGQMIIELINKRIPCSIDGAYNFIDVRDCASAVINAALKGRVGEGYILSGNVVTVEEMFTCIYHLFGRKKIPGKVPFWLAKLFCVPATWYYKIKRIKPLFNSYALYTLKSNHNFDNTKAKTELQLKVRPYQQSLTDAAKWMLKNKPYLFNRKKLKKA